MDQIENWNQGAFLALNARPGTAHGLLPAAQAIANDLIYLVPLILIALWVWGDRRQRSTALEACLIAGLALRAGQLIGLLWPHPRPFLIGVGHTWMAHAPDACLPSDHMTVFSAVGLCLAFNGEMLLGLALRVIGLVVAWARIYLGVHFPIDMLAAAAVAAFMYALVTPVWQRLGAEQPRWLNRPMAGRWPGRSRAASRRACTAASSRPDNGSVTEERRARSRLRDLA